MKYAIRVGREWYLGKMYTHQGDLFPCSSYDKEQAKWYKTFKVAKKAKATLDSKIAYDQNTYIVDENGVEVSEP